ncbi:MAG: excinuclease ABC subunit UvrC [Candidatus Omnitrophota bacterium]
MDFKELIVNAPNTCGVYLMRDVRKNIIYIGKARNLKKRISTYFSSGQKQVLKTFTLVNNIASVEYIKTTNEASALLLENALIKKYQPKYNISLKDDKSYPAIIITNEEFPRVFIGRPYKQTGDFKYYGPYPDAALLREAFKILRRIFKFRTCKNLPKESLPAARKACLYSKLNLCFAPCADRKTKLKYRQIINNVSLFLEGRYEELINSLTKKMFEAAKRKHFEEAKELRDEINALGSLFNIEDRAQNDLESLKKTLDLNKIPLRIEAFDISSIGESFKAGSLVSFCKGVADKSGYRRFKIKTVTGRDDYSCLEEVLNRRYSKLIREKASLPDLILIDGGKGHLSVGLEVLKRLRIDIPVISIAKENEIIFSTKKPSGVNLPRDSAALKLVQRIRDEAHRFAHSYNLLLRKKYLIK